MIDKERESEPVKTYLHWLHKGGTSLIRQNEDNTEKKVRLIGREKEREKKNERNDTVHASAVGHA